MINSIFYSTIGNIPKSLNSSFEQEYYPKISQEDVDRGFIMRYFTRQVNHDTQSAIREISEDSFKAIRTSTLYVTIEVPWRITGQKEEVSASNQLATEEAEKVFVGVKYRLTNYLQFYRGL